MAVISQSGAAMKDAIADQPDRSSVLADERGWVEDQLRRAPWHEVLWQHKRWLMCICASGRVSGGSGRADEREPSFRPADWQPSGWPGADCREQEDELECGGEGLTFEEELLAAMSKHATEAQRRSAERCAQMHRDWCAQWRKPPPPGDSSPCEP